MLGPTGCRSPITLASSSLSKSARRMRSRRPTCSAGSEPPSIQLRTVRWLSFRIDAISATVMKSWDSVMGQRYPLARCVAGGRASFRAVPNNDSEPAGAGSSRWVCRQ
jgi:hypothetical protein